MIIPSYQPFYSAEGDAYSLHLPSRSKPLPQDRPKFLPSASAPPYSPSRPYIPSFLQPTPVSSTTLTFPAPSTTACKIPMSSTTHVPLFLGRISSARLRNVRCAPQYHMCILVLHARACCIGPRCLCTSKISQNWLQFRQYFRCGCGCGQNRKREGYDR